MRDSVGDQLCKLIIHLLLKQDQSLHLRVVKVQIRPNFVNMQHLEKLRQKVKIVLKINKKVKAT